MRDDWDTMDWEQPEQFFPKLLSVDLPETYTMGVAFHDKGATIVVMKHLNSISTVVLNEFHKDTSK